MKCSECPNEINRLKGRKTCSPKCAKIRNRRMSVVIMREKNKAKSEARNIIREIDLMG